MALHESLQYLYAQMGPAAIGQYILMYTDYVVSQCTLYDWLMYR